MDKGVGRMASCPDAVAGGAGCHGQQGPLPSEAGMLVLAQHGVIRGPDWWRSEERERSIEHIHRSCASVLGEEVMLSVWGTQILYMV